MPTDDGGVDHLRGRNMGASQRKPEVRTGVGACWMVAKSFSELIRIYN
jgi:hypothetical protein